LGGEFISHAGFYRFLAVEAGQGRLEIGQHVGVQGAAGCDEKGEETHGKDLVTYSNRF